MGKALGRVDVFDLRHRVVEDYKAFVTSFMSIKDPRVQDVVDQELADGLLWPEPRIALNPAYADGGWVDDLVVRGTLDARCSEVFRLGKDRPGQTSQGLRLRRHQVEATEVARRHEAYILTTRQEARLHHPDAWRERSAKRDQGAKRPEKDRRANKFSSTSTGLRQRQWAFAPASTWPKSPVRCAKRRAPVCRGEVPVVQVYPTIGA